MQNNYLKLVSFVIFLLANVLQSAEISSLTQKEKLFLQEHPTIILGTSDSWAPYVMKDANGEVVGYDNDILTRVNNYTGANFVQVLGDWSKMQELAKNKKIDGLSTIGIFPERKQWFNFSNIYISLKKSVLVKPNNPLKIKCNEDLKGKTIVINKGNMPDQKIANQFKNSKIIYANTVEDMLKEVIYGEADATFGNGGTSYMLSKLGLPYLDLAYPLKNHLDLAFAIRKDWPEAISILNKGLETISDFERNNLAQKWFRPINVETNIPLTDKEQKYLKNKKYITMCIDPNWMPFEKFENGKHIGMSADYFKIFQKQIGIPINVIETETWEQSIEFAKSRKCDILSLAKNTKSRVKYLNFTDPYLIESVVLATKPNISFINNLKLLNTERIGIVKGYAFSEILHEQYPNLNIINVNDINDGLQKVSNGQLFGVIDTLPTIAYMFQTKFLGQLKISAKLIDEWKLGVAVRNDDLILLNIFNKIITNLSPIEKQNIFNNYIGVNYEVGFDYSLFWKIFLIFTIVIAIIYVRYIIIKKYNHKIKKYFKIIDSNFLTSTSDIEGNITDVSEALCKITGYKREELIGKNHNIFRHKDMPDSVFKNMWETILSGKTWEGEIKNLKKDGSYYWAQSKITPIFNSDGSIKGFSAIRHDITDKKKLEKLSVTDSLTQIPNRLYLNTNYKQEVKRAKRYKHVFSIILIDIDFFKKVNDTYGHSAGDDCLIQIAKILKENIRSIDILGRWGGEEFLIISPETDIDEAQIIAEKIRQKISDFNFPVIEHVTCSFGISQYHQEDIAEESFQRADKALYEAKNSGRNRIAIVR